MAKKKKKVEWSADDEALLAELDVEAESQTAARFTPRQERIIAGFEDIQRFQRQHGRVPQHGEDRDIFERLYAVRLDRIRASAECRELLRPFDADGLLDAPAAGDVDEMSDDELLAGLGVDAASVHDEITVMKHVRPSTQRKSPDEVAQRKPCEDFELFRPLFEQIQHDLSVGEGRTVPFKGQENQTIERGDWFIVDGQKAFVAETGKAFKQEYGETDRRLRVIFDNGTESPMLMRSLRRALNYDDASRRILPPDANVGPLFSNVAAEDDASSGTIYVARSLSDHPFIREHRELVHKIGVTIGDPAERVAGAKKDPTFLLADAEIVAAFKLANINRKKLEALLHKLFDSARLDLELKDRFGSGVEPREWFLVPLAVIEEAMKRIMDGSISGFRYDPDVASLVRA